MAQGLQQDSQSGGAAGKCSTQRAAARSVSSLCSMMVSQRERGTASRSTGRLDNNDWFMEESDKRASFTPGLKKGRKILCEG